MSAKRPYRVESESGRTWGKYKSMGEAAAGMKRASRVEPGVRWRIVGPDASETRSRA